MLSTATKTRLSSLGARNPEQPSIAGWKKINR